MKAKHLTLWIIFGLIALCACQRKPIVQEYKSRWIRLKHVPVEKVHLPDRAIIEVDIAVSPNVRDIETYVYYRTLPSGSLKTIEMQLADGHGFAEIPTMRRGTRVEYFIEARGDNDLALRVPSSGKGFKLIFQARPQPILLISHIALMILSLAIFISSGLLALTGIRKRRASPAIARAGFVGLVIFFISAIPLGMVVAYQTFGTPWSGFPVGNDLTDNKSLAIIVYFTVSSILYRGSLFRNDPSRDRLPIRAMPWVYLLGVILTLALFAIPH